MSSKPFAQLDRRDINRLLNEVDGNIAAAARFLQESGFVIEEKSLRGYILNDPFLNDMWLDIKGISKTEAPTEEEKETNPNLPTSPFAANMVAARVLQDSIVARRGLKGIGFSDERISKMIGYQNYASQAFSQTLDATHGQMVITQFKITERMEWIEDNIFAKANNKVSMDDKLRWQKSYNELADQIRKVADTSNRAAEIRVNALRKDMNNRAGFKSKKDDGMENVTATSTDIPDGPLTKSRKKPNHKRS